MEGNATGPNISGSHQEDGRPQSRSFEACLTEFECPKPVGGFRIEAAVATYELKGEDRFVYVTIASEPELEECQLSETATRMVAFTGVFDGHDGELASEYCSKGLLHHVLAETADCAAKIERQNGGKGDQEEQQKDPLERSILKEGHIAGFQRAQARFGQSTDPPTFSELRQGVKKVRAAKGLLERFFCYPQQLIRGGTTACTLALYSRFTDGDPVPMRSAVISNTGDSRCITDDASGTGAFRSVTSDHRPFKADEYRRLKPYISKGQAYLEKDCPGGCLRLYPGGLAVSRTVGDVSLSKAAVPTPEVFFSPLHFSSEKNRHRFVMGSDGLFDVFDTDEVGRYAAVNQPKIPCPANNTNITTPREANGESGERDGCAAEETTESAMQSRNVDEEDEMEFVSPKEAAKRVINSCIKAGGYEDDVTVMIVDICLADDSGLAYS